MMLKRKMWRKSEKLWLPHFGSNIQPVFQAQKRELKAKSLQAGYWEKQKKLNDVVLLVIYSNYCKYLKKNVANISASNERHKQK